MSGTDDAADDDRWVGGPQPGESPKERVDRELGELIEETRVVLPGVEILFGFLIILPFQFREELAGFERILYLGAFLAVSVGLALLVASTVEHRIRFRGLDKGGMALPREPPDALRDRVRRGGRGADRVPRPRDDPRRPPRPGAGGGERRGDRLALVRLAAAQAPIGCQTVLISTYSPMR
jgi:hypothetical protein